ncbi:SprT-like domain-containing protein [Enterovibrio calviensis]|uniref:SprT-like domain-containing protein n=1 Tax=Enterovibrio calviensis TaxID=91359 RepID=UPI003736E9BD
MTKPTHQMYQGLNDAFDYFNAELFESSLPQCLITLQRKPNTHGYLSRNRFVNSTGEVVSELALNPEMFPLYPVSEILQTLAHEMCHLWQNEHGKPSRGGYHNKEWAAKMQEIGLMPSSTGKVGGAVTGQFMGDYIVDGGRFESALNQLITNEFKLAWYDRFPPKKSIESSGTTVLNALMSSISAANPKQSKLNDLTKEESITPSERPQTRYKFTCPKCNSNLWGKPSLNVLCVDCDMHFLRCS